MKKEKFTRAGLEPATSVKIQKKIKQTSFGTTKQSDIHSSKKLKEHVDIMIFIERYPLKRCQGCVKLIASKVNCFLNITDLSEVQLCMSSNSWTWECPHTKDGADHVPLILLSSVLTISTYTGTYL